MMMMMIIFIIIIIIIITIMIIVISNGCIVMTKPNLAVNVGWVISPPTCWCYRLAARVRNRQILIFWHLFPRSGVPRCI